MTDAGKTDSVVMTVAELTRRHFNYRVTVEGYGSGWLYAIHDDFNDGYPDRTLIVVTSEAGLDEWRFSDSDPTGYPQTMNLEVAVSRD